MSRDFKEPGMLAFRPNDPSEKLESLLPILSMTDLERWRGQRKSPERSFAMRALGGIRGHEGIDKAEAVVNRRLGAKPFSGHFA